MERLPNTSVVSSNMEELDKSGPGSVLTNKETTHCLGKAMEISELQLSWDKNLSFRKLATNVPESLKELVLPDSKNELFQKKSLKGLLKEIEL